MKLNEAMKRAFESAVATRVQQMLDEQVEQAAVEQVKAILNGHAPKAGRAAHPVQYPPSTVLRRGNKEGLKQFRMTQQSGLMASAAWEALAKDGHFASKATRSDMTAYLMKTFPGTNSSQVSATISVCIQRGVLVPA